MIAALTAALAPHGLNLVGATPLDAYDAGVPTERALRNLAPDARTAIVIGNGGGAYWRRFRRDAEAHPERRREADPLDAWTARVVEAAARPVVGGAARIVYPFRVGDEPVSFMRLAACAGLGRPGRVGVLLHPIWGPWIALRAAILVDAVVHAARPAEQFDPCPACAEPACVAACPAGAVGSRGWDVAGCAASRGRDDDPCAAGCHARIACVIGTAHRYPPDALAYHQARARPALLGAFAGARPGAPADDGA